MLDLTSLKTIKELLAEYNMRPNKTLGQNFLLSHKVVAKIIAAAKLTRNDVVLEIGPGLGVLTIELAKHVKQVIVVEKDERLAEALLKNLRTEKLKNVKVIINDILNITGYSLPVTRYKVVANLPYQITSPVLWKFLHEEKNKPDLMILMVQKEVAERVIAKPGQMSLLSVLAQYYTEPSVVAHVKRTLFYPQPKVDSTVLKLRIVNFKFQIDEKKFIKLVKAGFQAKRKILKNNLNFSSQMISEALNKVNLSEKSRAQELSIDDWLNLYKMLYNNNMRT